MLPALRPAHPAVVLDVRAAGVHRLRAAGGRRPKCPECAAPTGRNRVITADQISGIGGAPVTRAMLVLCVAAWLLQLVAPQVFLYGAQVNVLVEAGEWWRVLTAALLHSRTLIFHLLFNMWALYSFGPQLERQAGPVPYAGLLLASGAWGGAAFFLLGPAAVPAVGASGMIFGLFGAWLAAAVRARNTAVGRASLNSLLLILGLNLALPLVFRSIAWRPTSGVWSRGSSSRWPGRRCPATATRARGPAPRSPTERRRWPSRWSCSV